MNKPFISIAMTTYNGAAYLRAQLDSIYQQTLLPDEVVICDDGSTDKTIEILKEYRTRYGLVYYQNNETIGYNRNFFKAISLCKGNYIFLSDQDDVWMSDKIEKTLRIMEQLENGPTLITTQVKDTDELLQELNKQSRLPFSSRLIDTLIFDGRNQGCTMLLNRSLADSVLKMTDLHGIYFYDVIIAAVAISIGTKYNFAEPTLCYRHHLHNAVGQIKNFTRAQLATMRSPYHHFCSPERLKALSIIYNVLPKDQVHSNAQKAYMEYATIMHANTWVRGLWAIWHLSELTIKEKITITLYSIGAAMAHIIYANN